MLPRLDPKSVYKYLQLQIIYRVHLKLQEKTNNPVLERRYCKVSNDTHTLKILLCGDFITLPYVVLSMAVNYFLGGVLMLFFCPVRTS